MGTQRSQSYMSSAIPFNWSIINTIQRLINYTSGKGHWVPESGTVDLQPCFWMDSRSFVPCKLHQKSQVKIWGRMYTFICRKTCLSTFQTWCATCFQCSLRASRQCLKNLNLICSCTTCKMIANTKASWKCERCSAGIMADLSVVWSLLWCWYQTKTK